MPLAELVTGTAVAPVNMAIGVMVLKEVVQYLADMGKLHSSVTELLR